MCILSFLYHGFSVIVVFNETALETSKKLLYLRKITKKRLTLATHQCTN